MGATALLADLHSRGITLTVSDDRLVVDPPGALTTDDRAALRAHRDELNTLAAIPLDERCSVCPRGLEVFDPTGTPWCEIHTPDSERWQLDHAQRVVEAFQTGRPLPMPGPQR